MGVAYRMPEITTWKRCREATQCSSSTPPLLTRVCGDMGPEDIAAIGEAT